MDDAGAASVTDAVSGPRMMADLTEIARWVKLSGTAEEAEALRFIEGRLGDAGYRIATIRHDAYVSLPGPARVEVDNQSLTAITHSFSRPSPEGGLAGEVVHVGQGTEADFADKDLTGRIALIDGMATPANAQLASRAGAAGQIQISHQEHRHEMCISPVWGSPSPATLGALPTTVAATLSKSDGSALRERVLRGERPRVVIHAAVDTGWRSTPLLVAELDAPGGGPDTPFVMLSGHHDTWYHGVMDNGSANAGMLEVARLCAERRDRWKRGLRLCFWSGHSHGRYSGSTWYADTHWDELERRCVAHVNVDSLGGAGATDLAKAAAMSELRHIAAEAVERAAGQRYLGGRKARNSDESFGGIGIPSMFGAISEQAPGAVPTRNHLGWWWHTPHDTLDKIDEANQVRDTRVLALAVWRLLTDPVVPLDHAATAEALLAELAGLRGRLGDRFDLAGPVAAAEAVRDRSRAVRARTAADALRVDRALMRASRALVPVDYTPGDRFAHAEALPLPPWTVLEPIRVLAATAAGTDAARFATVEANRARSRLGFALREASRALDDALAAMSG
ncbi:M28 family peptidase [Elioraea sp.]|uniref:M28 family peptidase n=1 Tax=Elioraea sp. TaxID=2185103 RepID=UPI003F71BC3D